MSDPLTSIEVGMSSFWQECPMFITGAAHQAAKKHHGSFNLFSFLFHSFNAGSALVTEQQKENQIIEYFGLGLKFVKDKLTRRIYSR